MEYQIDSNGAIYFSGSEDEHVWFDSVYKNWRQHDLSSKQSATEACGALESILNKKNEETCCNRGED